jgi:hypothetical protein
MPGPRSHISILTILICLYLPIISVSGQSSADQAIASLNTALEKKDEYTNIKLLRIKNLKSQLSNTHRDSLRVKFDLYNELYHEFKIFVYDSAFKYANKLSQTARNLHDPKRISYSKLKMSFILLSAGMFKETFDTLKAINKRTLTDSSKIDYYRLMARAFFDVSSYDNDLHLDQNYVSLGRQYLDSAKILCVPNSDQYLYISTLNNLMAGNISHALRDVQALIQLPLSAHEQAINNYHLGELYQAQGLENESLTAFVASAIGDIESVTKENTALNRVADILYKRGDVKNAYKYIEAAMEDALFYGANQRKKQIGTFLHIIGAEKLSDLERQRSRWRIYSTIITILGILLFILGIVVIKQVKKLKIQVHKLQEAELQILKANQILESINHQLRENDKIKEEYIGYYFNINSDYIDKIENFLQTIDHKLTNKKYEDIRFIVNNLNIKRQKEELFVNFDKVFLKLFPDFVTTFNSFFKEEDRIILKENELLTTELRIFALIRMGINDTKKIAKILGYSVNSIYTYKTKIKNKSIVPNEAFEDRIMMIKTI